MIASEVTFFPLAPHPATSGGPVRRLAAGLELNADRTLRLRYVLDADLRQVRVPPPVPGAGRADRLWAHTCFEAFVAAEDSPGYLELNLSPSGEWAAYRFRSYREGMAPAELAAPPQLEVERNPHRLELHATVRMALAGRLRVGLSAVVEDDTGGLSYWALRHPSGRPDFHHPDSFSLALAPLPSP